MKSKSTNGHVVQLRKELKVVLEYAKEAAAQKTTEERLAADIDTLQAP